MIRCTVIIEDVGGDDVDFQALPRPGDEVAVPLRGDTYPCRVDKIRHIAEGSGSLKLPASTIVFVSRI